MTIQVQDTDSVAKKSISTVSDPTAEVNRLTLAFSSVLFEGKSPKPLALLQTLKPNLNRDIQHVNQRSSIELTQDVPRQPVGNLYNFTPSMTLTQQKWLDNLKKPKRSVVSPKRLPYEL